MYTLKLCSWSNWLDIWIQVAGADVNQKLFLGYATTAAAREGNIHILEMLLQAGVTREACEDSLSEAALFAEAEAVRLLVCSEMIQPEAAAHALVTASSRGFDDVVVILLQVWSNDISYIQPVTKITFSCVYIYVCVYWFTFILSEWGWR